MFQTYPYAKNLGLAYQAELFNKPKRELPLLSDGHRSHAVLQRAARWLETRLNGMGENVPCVGLEPACDMRFTA